MNCYTNSLNITNRKSKKQIEIAIEMKKDERFSNEDIQKFTGLTIEQLAMI